ncbi:hypothetical protein KFE98_17415 [bacterium SCSIO 12741]|nr:hypothetical protein KFE98_17415 [bacterium SCSIO 12741]
MLKSAPKADRVRSIPVAQLKASKPPQAQTISAFDKRRPSGLIQHVVQAKKGLPVNDSSHLDKGSLAGDVIQLQASKVKNRFGEFDATTYKIWPGDENRNKVGAEIQLNWNPNRNHVAEGTYGFIQKVNRQSLGLSRVHFNEVEKTRKNSDVKIKEYHKRGHGKKVEAFEKGNVSDFFKRISIENSEQHHIDSLGESYSNKAEFRTDHPMYGAEGKKEHLELDPVPDSDRNALGRYPAHVTPTEVGKAQLYDLPAVSRYYNAEKQPLVHNVEEGNVPTYEFFGKDHFEVRVVGLSGDMKGKYLGGIQWGWINDKSGHRLLPPSIVLQNRDLPSKSFIEASKKWNEAEVAKPEDEQKKQSQWFMGGGSLIGAGAGLFTAGVAWPVIPFIAAGAYAGKKIGDYKGSKDKINTVPIPIPEPKKKKKTQ